MDRRELVASMCADDGSTIVAVADGSRGRSLAQFLRRAGREVAFVPSGITYHGFEARRIEGVRKSVIINYVTNEWRAREQLAFPDKPIAQ